jgi:hypothetical protein
MPFLGNILGRILHGVIPLGCDVVIAGYREADFIATLKFLKIIKQNVQLGGIYLVANSQEAAKVFGTAQDGHFIDGSNRDGEWSAYQEGIDAARRQNPDLCRGLLILNDTVTTHRMFSAFYYLAWLDRLRGAKPDELIGFNDRVDNQNFAIFGLPVSNWVSSYLMYIGPDLLKSLNFQICADKEVVDQWFHEARVDQFFPAWLSPNLRDHLADWLFGGQWYGSQPLCDDNLAKFRFKAKAIFYEKALSARAAQLGTITPVMPKLSMWRALNSIHRRLESMPLVRPALSGFHM